MRNLCILLSFSFSLSLSLAAQSHSGKVLLTGNTSASVNFNNPDRAFWNVRSARVGYFFSNRLVAGTDVEVTTFQEFGTIRERIKLKPFLRYYLTTQAGRKLNYFGQLGFGTFGEFEFGTNYETDFHLGVGLDYAYSSDLSAEALVRYNANAYGLNFTEVALRVNTYIGGGNGKSYSPLLAGTVMIDPTGGNLEMGFRGREDVSHILGSLTVGGGYIIHDHLLVEGKINYVRDAYQGGPNSFEGLFSGPQLSNLTAEVGVRYLMGSKRLRPYAMGGTSFRHSRTRFPDRNGNFSEPVVFSAAHAYSGGGVLLGLTERIALDGQLRYSIALSDGVRSFAQANVGLKVFLAE